MDGASQESIVWSVAPWRQNPRRVAIIAGFAVFAFSVGMFALRSPLLGLAGFAIITGATAEYWLGTNFRLDQKGASSRVGPSLSSMTWEEVKRVQIAQDFLKLSPLEEDSRLSAFRGITLATTLETRGPVLDWIKEHVNQDVRLLEI